MSALRFYHVDVDFFHKGTCARLLSEFGPWGPLVWLALIAQAKQNNPTGQITWVPTAEGLVWRQLGFYEQHITGAIEFSFSDFLNVTGKLKNTRRTPIGRLENVQITSYKDWQNEAKRYEEQQRKARKRQESVADIERTEPGQKADLELELDNPPNPPQIGGGSKTSKRELRKYTGCRVTRGSMGQGWKYNVLGIDEPPKNWPYPKPTEEEIAMAMEVGK